MTFSRELSQFILGAIKDLMKALPTKLFSLMCLILLKDRSSWLRFFSRRKASLGTSVSEFRAKFSRRSSLGKPWLGPKETSELECAGFFQRKTSIQKLCLTIEFYFLSIQLALNKNISFPFNCCCCVLLKYWAYPIGFSTTCNVLICFDKKMSMTGHWWIADWLNRQVSAPHTGTWWVRRRRLGQLC